MPHWLYTEIIKEDDLRVPRFARQSTLNWMRSLRYEIVNEHGGNAKNQFISCLTHFKNVYKTKLECKSKGAVFENLYSSLTNSLALQTCAKKCNIESWLLPNSIVCWYYSLYFSILSIFGCIGQKVDENHATVYRAFASNLSHKMPHPLNMNAEHVGNENYISILPNYPSAQLFSLSKTFPETEEAAKGMLLEYLSGNSKYYTSKTKDTILKKSSFSDFRTKEAREERNRKLQKKISFMHCAFRYRGKANYRDGIYLTYGASSEEETKAYLSDLAQVSMFCFLMGLSLAYRSPLKKDVQIFINDVNENLKGISDLEESDCFWKVL